MQRTLTTLTVLGAATAIAGVAATSLTRTASSPVAAMPASDAAAPMAQCLETDTISAIFAPGTDPEIVEMVSEAIKHLAPERFSPGNRWPGADNTPVNITYSFPSDGINVPNGVGEGSAPNDLHAQLTSKFGSEALWKSKFAQIFQAWEDITGNVYTEVSDDDAPLGSSGPLHGGSGRGDIRITGKNIDGSSGILAYNSFPGSGVGGDMVIDTSENWGNSFNDYIFFRNTLSHEHGHGMGLGHVCPAVGIKLMEPFLNTSFDGPQHDDIRGATHHYGDYYEPNNNSASAAFLGGYFGPGSVPFDVPNMALRDDTDDDFYSFSVDGAGSIDVSVEIVGETYDNSSQNSDGTCGSGNIFDSTVRVDPDLAILDINGSTVLASVNANGFGGDETLTNVTLPDAGTYYIRVRSVSANGAAQIYDLTGSVTIDEAVTGCVGDLNGDMIVDTADLGILIGVFGTNSPLADLNGDNLVDTADLGILIGVFGGCTPL